LLYARYFRTPTNPAKSITTNPAKSIT